MSLKQEIETWVSALAHYDRTEFDASLKAFNSIADTSKILFNCGVIHATLGEHERAVDCYQKAVQLDQYLAVAYFQQGVSNFLMGDFEEALANFNDTLLYLRGNNNIDYDQLGLKFKLHSCEVLFNRGLCYIYLQQKQAGMQDLFFAAKEKAVQDHDVIDEAIREQAEGYTVFSIPVGIVYRPNEAKVKNLKTKDYLGKARLVAAQDQQNSASNFDARRHIMQQAATLEPENRYGQELSYAALNLVRPGLTSCSTKTTRLQSEPPINRSMFPPTPPPEMENRPSSATSRRKSTESASSAPSGFNQTRPSGTKPARLNLGIAAFEQPPPQAAEKPRLGTVRSASERPRATHDRSLRLRDAEEHDRRSFVEGQYRSRNSMHEYQLQQQTQPEQLQPTIYHRRSKSSTKRPVSIEEEEEGEGVDSENSSTTSSHSALAFEIIPPRTNRQRSRSRAESSSRRTVEMRKIRVKLHAEEDTRYMMIAPDVRFTDFVEQVRTKLVLKGGFKLKMRDEDGDMVTMGDQEDLEMAVSACRKVARRGRVGLGKMDIWVHET